MNNIKINEAKRVIEVTKAFVNKASVYGTIEYKELREVRNDFPGFKVVTKNAGKKNGQFKGLTIDYMKKYIEEHNEEYIEDFCVLCGRDKNWEELEFAATATYGEIKAWFLKKYPEFKAYTQKVESVLKSA